MYKGLVPLWVHILVKIISHRTNVLLHVQGTYDKQIKLSCAYNIYNTHTAFIKFKLLQAIKVMKII